MTCKHPGTENNTRLRQLAEQRAQLQDFKASGAIQALSTEEIRALVHELQVQKIELALQNDELRQTKLALEAMRQRYYEIYDRAPIGYCTLSEIGLILEINHTGARLLGNDGNSLVNQSLSDVILPEDQDIYSRFHRALFTMDEAQVCELRMVKDSGEVFWARLEATAASGAEGPPGCFQIMFNNISAGRRAEETMRENEKRFSATFEQAAVGIAHVATDGRWLRVNNRLCDIVGYSREELQNKRFQDITHPDDLNENLSQLQKLLAGKITQSSVQKRYISKNGASVWTNLTVSLVRNDLGAPDYFVTVIEDISKRKAAQQALRESEEIFSHFMDHSPIYVIVKDHNLRILRLSKNFEHLLGLPMGELMGRSAEELFPSGLARKMIDDDKRILEEGKVLIVEEEFNDRSYTTIKFPIVIQGKIRYLAGYSIDITQHKKDESERELLTKAIEQSGEAIVITDPSGIIQYVNHTFESETGYLRHEAIGNSTRILKSGQQDDKFYQHLWSTLSRGETFNGRMVNKRKDGSFFTEDATISPVFDHAGDIANYVAVKRNVTEHVQLEESFQQAQKMESIGRLAGGVAHDFSNMLSVIIGYAELLMAQVGRGGPLQDDLQEILNAAKRSSGITRQLLAFARKQAIVPQTLSLNTTVEEMLKMLRRLLGESITLSWKPGAGLWPIKMDPSQVNQILANLCVNAGDAINGHGQVTIETANVVLDGEYCALHAGAKTGEFLQLTVSDNGCGMDRQTLKMVFEPFFTTKGLGKGTGLGLSTVYGIVKQNNGFIYIDSELDQGTTVNIYLPQHADAGELTADTDEAPIPAGYGETILVVEDERAILRYLSRALGELGYAVFSASSPGEAIKIAEAQPGSIDLLLTDVIMPELNGWELAKRIQSSQPEASVLFMSGYTHNVIFEDGPLEDGISFIPKPLAKADLAAKIRAILE